MVESAIGNTRFYLKYAWFNIREQFSDLGSGIASFLLFPFFVWLIAMLWARFNAYQGHYTFNQILLYIGVTEVLFMSFLSSGSIHQAFGDFSLSLARPRSWPALSLTGLFGRCLGSRVIYLVIFLGMMPLLGVDFGETQKVALQLIVFLPLLGVIQALVGMLFASAQILWTETSYFILPISKIFLALGGVFGPLIDFGEPWRTRLLALPPSDIFFQPAHFCVKGSFYQMTGGTWLMHMILLCTALAGINFVLYRFARKYHQSYGG